MKRKYKTKHSPGHPLLANKGLLVGTHRRVLYEKIGPGPHPCHWCKRPIDWMPGRGVVQGALLVDHLDNNSLNNTPNNLVPSCHKCNVCRGLQSRLLKPGELFLTYKNGDRLRAKIGVCEWCRGEFLTRLDSDQRFCSRHCAGKGAFVGREQDRSGPSISPNRSLAKEQVLKIRKLLATRISCRTIAKSLGINKCIVYGINSGKTYIDVQLPP